MSIWRRLAELADGGVIALGAIFDWAGSLVSGFGDPELRRQIAFSVAMIALSAKMAKADGVVSTIEVDAIRRHFTVPANDERHLARIFNLAKGNVAGSEVYARRVAAFYGDDRKELQDVLDGLFVIAAADGAVDRAEFGYLERVAEIFGIEDNIFDSLAERHIVMEEGDPYLVLGVDRGKSSPISGNATSNLSPNITPIS